MRREAGVVCERDLVAQSPELSLFLATGLRWGGEHEYVGKLKPFAFLNLPGKRIFD